MTVQSERQSPTIYQVENLPEGRHFFTTRFPENFQLLNQENNFHGLAKPGLKIFWGINPLNFLLKCDESAHRIIYDSKQKYPLRGSEGIIKKIHFSGHTLALKALYPNSLTGYKQIKVFSNLIKPIFDKNKLKTVDHSAATPHSLIRPWIKGLTLDVIFDQLKINDKELANSIYTLLARNVNFKNVHNEIFLALTQYLKTFGFIPMNHPYHRKITQAEDQLSGKTSAKFTIPGEEDMNILKSIKIMMTVDCAIPYLGFNNVDLLSEQLVKDRLSNWILPDRLVNGLPKIKNPQYASDFLLQNIVCLDPFYIRSDIGSSDGQ